MYRMCHSGSSIYLSLSTPMLDILITFIEHYKLFERLLNFESKEVLFLALLTCCVYLGRRIYVSYHRWRYSRLTYPHTGRTRDRATPLLSQHDD